MAWWFKRKKDLSIDLAMAGGVVMLGDDLDAGFVVDRETALEISTVFACINILVQSVGQVPIAVYSRDKDGRKPADWTREYKRFKFGPNSWQTTQDWVEQLMMHLLTYGDYFARIGKVDGYFDELYPFEDPSKIRPSISAGQKRYEVANDRDYKAAEIFHLHAPSVDGFSGREITDTHRQTLSLARSLFRYGARFFGNGAQMRGILILPAGAGVQDVKDAKELFKTTYGGSNLHDVAVYSQGTDYKPIDVDPEKSQALGTRELVSKEIASLFNVPLWRLYGETPPNYEARVSFYTDTLGPWFRRIDGGINKYLLAGADRRAADLPGEKFYAEFNTDSLLRSDIDKRFTAYTKAIQSRFMTPNEVRQKENMVNFAGGDEMVNPHVMSAKRQEALATLIEAE